MSSQTEYPGLSGEELQRLSDAYPPIKPAGLGPAIIGLLITWSIITTVVVGLRVWVKTQRLDPGQKWGVDDYLAVIGWLPFVPSAGLGIMAVKYGLGARDEHVNELLKIQARKYALLYEMVYYSASTITKVAIAATILRICVRKRYRYIIWVNMIIMGCVSCGAMIFQLSDCRPFAAYWNKRLYLGTSVQILTDWTCAITPFFVVRDLQMHRRVKISVIAILGLGIFASFAAVLRICFYPFIDVRYHPDDELYHHSWLIFWSSIEGGLAIVACSLPSLRKLFGKFFRGSSAQSKNKTHTGSGVDRNMFRNGGSQLNSLTPQGKSRTLVSTGGGGKWDRLSDEADNDASSHIQIIKRTEVCVKDANSDNLSALEAQDSDWRDTDSNRIQR